MKTISLDITKATSFLAEGAVNAYESKVKAAQEALENGTCAGNDFLGWLHLPSSITPDFLAEIEAVAKTLREKCEVVVVAGIGGSYLGARAVIEGLGNSFAWLVADKKNPTILFAGNNIGEDYLYELTTYLKDKKFGVINISKSGTTTETALAFRLLKKQCEDQRGKEEAKDVIVAVTDAKKGAARTCADKEGYKSFIIPDNVGGRFSVLTPVGLLPIAVAGFDVKQLVAGAADMEKACALDVPFADNLAAQYAATRQALYTQAGKKIEIVANFQPKLHYFAEWWKQLYGESEGKEQKGIFPDIAAVGLSSSFLFASFHGFVIVVADTSLQLIRNFTKLFGMVLIGSTMESSQLPLIAHRFQKPDIVPQCVDCFVDIAIAGSKGMDAIKIPKAKNQFFPQKLFQLD